MNIVHFLYIYGADKVNPLCPFDKTEAALVNFQANLCLCYLRTLIR
ncbi:hypothetical protein CLOSYM_00504 [[Clostridium] symbiosum ATCC 14940]|uniref:Uncharacterized protein n=1 Tax=[Clostridium] symbiosum ATCC 14940 TaxID=411472 RepID=A0ABC9U3C7_CLOSY|nr:hypothetical protein CLOSYM_00504 [[Clostridium] symbiosum ATCC 14940]